jgi:hypothetical protein
MTDEDKDRLRRLRDRASRALGTHQVQDAVAKVRAIVGPGSIPASEPDAQKAWDKLRDGDEPGPDELAALEHVIRLLRPAPLSRGGALDDLPDTQGHNLYPPDLKDAWSDFQTLIKPLLYSVGRINLTEGSTGLLAAGRAQVSFQRETGTSDLPEHTVAIEGVLRVHKSFDIALLAIPKTDRPAVTLEAAAPADGVRVAVIGYPAKDEVRNPIFTAAVFGTKFGVKRAALGEVLDGSATPTLFHDCSTLGGNSGSPVFQLETCRVIGIHRSGFFMYRNEAVDGASLDAFVRGT